MDRRVHFLGPLSFIFMQKICQTRMHSSRMCTVRCSGRLLGMSAYGGGSAQGDLPDTPPVNRITPCRNYVADGNNRFLPRTQGLTFRNPGSDTLLVYLIRWIRRNCLVCNCTTHAITKLNLFYYEQICVETEGSIVSRESCKALLVHWSAEKSRVIASNFRATS